MYLLVICPFLDLFQALDWLHMSVHKQPLGGRAVTQLCKCVYTTYECFCVRIQPLLAC